MSGDGEEHVHVWGLPEMSRICGTWHRRCLGCRWVTLDLSDEDEEVEEVEVVVESC
jgi:hypothetical protein